MTSQDRAYCSMWCQVHHWSSTGGRIAHHCDERLCCTDYQLPHLFSPLSAIELYNTRHHGPFQKFQNTHHQFDSGCAIAVTFLMSAVWHQRPASRERDDAIADMHDSGSVEMLLDRNDRETSVLTEKHLHLRSATASCCSCSSRRSRCSRVVAACIQGG